MAVAIGDIVRIVPRLRWAAVADVSNVFHFTVLLQDEPNDTDFMVEVALLIDPLFGTLAPHQTTNLIAVNIEGKNVTQDLLLPTTVWPAYTGGDVAGPANAPQTAPFSYFPTIKPRTQGRIYWPVVSDVASTNGNLSATAFDDHEAVADALLLPLATASVILAYIVFNREFGTWVIPSTAVTAPTLRTQRRRRPGVGS